MIEELRLENFASITGELLFSEGLNVIVGETGAGKSLLLEAISFLTGKKFSLLTDNLFVEAVFRVSESQIFVRREIKNNRSRCFLNGMRVPQKLLAEKVSPLISFQSQRQSITLLKPFYQLRIIDLIAQNEELLKKYRELFSKYRSLLSTLKELKEKRRERDREADLLKFQIEEIREVNFTEEEEEELLTLRDTLRQAEEIKELKRVAKEYIYEGEGSALEKISHVLGKLEKLTGTEELLEKLQNLYYELESVYLEIEKKFSVPEDTPPLDEIEERLYQIEKIKRKYGTTYEEVMKFLKEAEEKLNILENLEFEIEHYEEEIKKLMEEIYSLAKEISKRRKRAAEKFESYVISSLKTLGMERVKFKVEFKETEEPSPTGIDEVEFLFSGNPSLPLSPLSSSISGGELSRFLLVTLSMVSEPSVTMVFDEIDTGMSGRVLSLVAEKLKEISLKQQVIAVTHSPQLVAAAEKVFKVEKGEEGIKVKELDKKQKEEEIAIMISGTLTEKSLEAAKDLVKKWEEGWKVQG